MKCLICQKFFERKVHNAKYCSLICRKEGQKQLTKIWHASHKESENLKSRIRMSLYSKEELSLKSRSSKLRRGLRVLTKTTCKICQKEFIPASINAETCSLECKQIRDNSRDKKYFNNKYSTDINYRLALSLRNRLNKVIKRESRAGSAVKDLGCSIEEFHLWLESKFYPNPITGEVMSWNNHASMGWHIDHIRPLSSFDLTAPEQLKEACCYINLQPLWWFENLSKGAKVDI